MYTEREPAMVPFFFFIQPGFPLVDFLNTRFNGKAAYKVR